MEAAAKKGQSEPKPKAITENDAAWNRIFQSLSISEEIASEGYFDISADQIKEHGNREPRLLAKMDFEENLPEVMRKSGLALLAIKNGKYRIAKFNPFIRVKATPPEIKVERIKFPKDRLVSINPSNLGSESVVLDAAMASGILGKAFQEAVELTIRGRCRSQSFSFNLSGVGFDIDGVQIEVDGGYEGKESIHLVEAKIGSSTNISVRQILYPHTSWEHTLKAARASKKVRSYLCFYEAPTLRFIPVIQSSEGVWTTDHLREQCFQFEDGPQVDILSIPVQKVQPHPQADRIPFPQADRFDVLIAMFSMVAASASQTLTKEFLFKSFDLSERQIDYYANALRWLGLVTVERKEVQLTPFGREVSSMSHAERIGEIAKVVFADPIYHSVLHKPKEPVPAAMFAKWKVVGSATQFRRRQTVAAWISYFKKQTGAE